MLLLVVYWKKSALLWEAVILEMLKSLEVFKTFKPMFAQFFNFLWNFMGIFPSQRSYRFKIIFSFWKFKQIYYLNNICTVSLNKCIIWIMVKKHVVWISLWSCDYFTFVILANSVLNVILGSITVLKLFLQLCVF